MTNEISWNGATHAVAGLLSVGGRS